jgi:hypothetical protein
VLSLKVSRLTYCPDALSSVLCPFDFSLEIVKRITGPFFVKTKVPIEDLALVLMILDVFKIF